MATENISVVVGKAWSSRQANLRMLEPDQLRLYIVQERKLLLSATVRLGLGEISNSRFAVYASSETFRLMSVRVLQWIASYWSACARVLLPYTYQKNTLR